VRKCVFTRVQTDMSFEEMAKSVIVYEKKNSAEYLDLQEGSGQLRYMSKSSIFSTSNNGSLAKSNRLCQIVRACRQD
jgi:hypothetical protein